MWRVDCHKWTRGRSTTEEAIAISPQAEETRVRGRPKQRHPPRTPPPQPWLQGGCLGHFWGRKDLEKNLEEGPAAEKPHKTNQRAPKCPEPSSPDALSQKSTNRNVASPRASIIAFCWGVGRMQLLNSLHPSHGRVKRHNPAGCLQAPGPGWRSVLRTRKCVTNLEGSNRVRGLWVHGTDAIEACRHSIHAAATGDAEVLGAKTVRVQRACSHLGGSSILQGFRTTHSKVFLVVDV